MTRGIDFQYRILCDCFDNALAESFFATLECELLARQPPFRTHAEARAALFASSAGFYNRHRRPAALGYRAPEAYERRYTQHQQAVA